MKTDYRTLSDKTLAELLRQSDNHAFKEIYNRYWPMLYNHALRLLNHRTRAEDLVQNIFERIFINMSEFDPAKPLKPYLYRAVMNGVIDLGESDKTMRKYKLHYKRYNQEGHCTIDDDIRAKELNELIEQEIENMPSRMRAVFEFSWKAHLSHKEIAAALAISENTVKKQLYYAIRKIRSKIGSNCFFLIMQVILGLHKIVRLLDIHKDIHH